MEKTLKVHWQAGRDQISPNPYKGKSTWIFIGKTDMKLKWLCQPDVEPTSLKRPSCCGKIESARKGGRQRIRWLQVHWLNDTGVEVWTWKTVKTGKPEYYGWWGLKELTQLSNWTQQKHTSAVLFSLFDQQLMVWKHPAHHCNDGNGKITFQPSMFSELYLGTLHPKELPVCLWIWLPVGDKFWTEPHRTL